MDAETRSTVDDIVADPPQADAATIASLRPILEPQSIAIIGASRRDGSIGNRLFRNALQQGFTGVLYPVNPNAEAVASVRAYPSVLDVPGEVDLAVVAVEAEQVMDVARECGQKGVRGVVVISSGFGESGPEGIARQNELVEIARGYGMRLVGPNCMGVINTHPAVSMNASFSPVYPPAGNIALCTQSGALGLAVLEYARSLSIGLSTFVSIGNRADVSSNDLLQYWHDDPATDVILLYLESFGNPRNFARITRAVTARKPVVAVKGGRTLAGSRAAASHTGALATAEVASEALFRQAGIIRVDTLEELFDVANLLSHQPIPPGRRVAILTNGGGPGILVADACATRNLELPSLAPTTIAALQRLLPERASFANPVDMTAEATASDCGEALDLLARDDNVDIAIVIFVATVSVGAAAAAAAIRGVAPDFRQRGKTLVASFLGMRAFQVELGSPEEGYVPCFTFPESSAAALARACDYSNWLKRPKGVTPKLEGIDVVRAGRVVEAALARDPRRPLWLDAASVAELLGAYGIAVAPSRAATTATEAARAAEAMGFPVAVKLLSDTITHKTDVGGVILDLRTAAAVERAAHQIRERLAAIGREAEMQGVLVQKMAPGEIEVIIGVTQDPQFGPLMLFGLGGVYAELFKDIALRLHPLTDIDAREMLRSVKTYQLLEGWRGSKPCDVAALERLLLTVSAMVDNLPQIAELDLNPVKTLGDGYIVVDARVLLR